MRILWPLTVPLLAASISRAASSLTFMFLFCDHQRSMPNAWSASSP